MKKNFTSFAFKEPIRNYSGLIFRYDQPVQSGVLIFKHRSDLQKDFFLTLENKSQGLTARIQAQLASKLFQLPLLDGLDFELCF